MSSSARSRRTRRSTMAAASSKRLVRSRTVLGRCCGIDGFYEWYVREDAFGANSFPSWRVGARCTCGPILVGWTLRQSLQSDSGGVRSMQVRDGMSNVVLTVGPRHTLREAAA